jgi:hypothetical protein
MALDWAQWRIIRTVIPKRNGICRVTEQLVSFLRSSLFHDVRCQFLKTKPVTESQLHSEAVAGCIQCVCMQSGYTFRGEEDLNGTLQLNALQETGSYPSMSADSDGVCHLLAHHITVWKTNSSSNFPRPGLQSNRQMCFLCVSHKIVCVISLLSIYTRHKSIVDSIVTTTVQAN